MTPGSTFGGKVLLTREAPELITTNHHIPVNTPI